MTSWPDAWELVADDGTVTPVVVPGTVTQAYPDAFDADQRTWVFRTVLPGGGDLVLDGVATAYEVVVDGRVLLRESSMHARHRIPLGELAPGAVLELRCLPLSEALPPERPRARWRTALADNGLRLVRTCLLGRCPGIADGPPVVGPYREVRLEQVRPVTFRTTLDGSTGVLRCSDEAVTFTCAGRTGTGVLRLPDVALWWPHTHGTPTLHDVTVAGEVVARVGFRSVVNADPQALDLVVNGVPVWARGAVWTPPGLLAGLPEDPWDTVLAARDAGMNLLRVPGLAPYETARFLEACDELGVLVWHDLALANLDVPHELLGVDHELRQLLELAEGHPCLAVVCGGSETAQQVAMLGLPEDLWHSELLDVQAPAAVAGRAVWVPNSPYGGGLAIRSGGVAHWFAVGGYRRPLLEARARPPVFASECLAFSSGDGEWVPRDNGADWDFADVTRHYADLLGRPAEVVVGEVMASVLGEWRRSGSVNRGALVLWLRDLQPGAGWGVLDHTGLPKAAWWHLRRALDPQALWLTDEGLDGLAVHLANDRPEPWTGDLRVSTYRADGVRLEEVTVPVSVPGHGAWRGDAEDLLGGFRDLTWAYRFGPAAAGTVFAAFDGRQAVHAVSAPPPTAGLAVARDGEHLVLSAPVAVDTVLLSGRPDDNAFWLEPGVPRRLRVGPEPVSLRAVNLLGTWTG